MSASKYPFATKAEIRKRVATDDAFLHECFAVLQARYEARLRGVPMTGSAGWMVSDANVATRLAVKLADGLATATEKREAARVVARYAKQLAVHLRELELVRNPALATVAAVFGVGSVGAPVGSEPLSLVGQPEEEAPTAAASWDGAGEQAAAPPASPEPAGPPVPAHASVARPSRSRRETAARPLSARLLAFLGKHPDSKAVALAAALGVEVAEVSATLRELVDEGAVTRRGVGRGTTYTAVT